MPRPGTHPGNQKLNWLMFDLSKTVGGPSTTDGPVPAAGASTVYVPSVPPLNVDPVVRLAVPEASVWAWGLVRAVDNLLWALFDVGDDPTPYVETAAALSAIR